MGVYINKLEMPKGENITIKIEPNGKVYQATKHGDMFFITNCKAKAIKEPHGRLIDEDTIEVPRFTLATDTIKVLDAIENAPTVIEQESNNGSRSI